MKVRDDGEGGLCAGWSVGMEQESLCAAKVGLACSGGEVGGVEFSKGDVSAKVAALFDGDAEVGEGRREKD